MIEQSQRGIGSSSVDEDGTVYDWKGDPMVINPGDVLPFAPPPKKNKPPRSTEDE